jgi:hypothetical protein
LFEEPNGQHCFCRIGSRKVPSHAPILRLSLVLLQFVCCSERGEPCSVPVSCLPHAFLQSIVCRSAVHCLKSQRVALLSQDMWREGAFTCTHTLIVACTSFIRLLYWLGTCVNFIPNSEWSLALFLSVVCPTLFCNQ